MKTLGISIYLTNSTLEEDLAYIEQAGELGFKKIFTCLLSYRVDPETMTQRLSSICEKANSYGMKVFADVNNEIFKTLSNDLKFYKDMELSGIRLDSGFSIADTVEMTHNPYGLIVELNASINDGFINHLASFQPNFEQLSMCHNFYPMEYSGLPLQFMNDCNENIREFKLPIAAFVTSQSKEAKGPWAEGDIFCSLEQHRHLPISAQMKHYAQMPLIDEVIVANSPATQEELEAMVAYNSPKLFFDIEEEYELTNHEKEVVYNHNHFIRADISDYMFRSTMPRIVYKGKRVEVNNTRDLKVGDVVILNHKAGRYENEVHIIRQDMPNDASKNVVGHIVSDELFLLDYAKANQQFTFIKK